MPQLSTGLVIAGAYADKLRRVLFAQLRDAIKRGEIDNKTVARRAGELNRLLYEILVNKLKLDKGDAVRIRIEYEVKNGDIEWRLDTLRIEAFRRIPDDEVEKIVRESIGKVEEILAREITEEERAWTEAREREVEREVQRKAEAARTAAREAMEAGERREAAKTAARPADFQIVEAMFYGETIQGEKLATLKNASGDNIGVAIVEPLNGSSRVTLVLVPGKGKAYKATVTVEAAPSELEENPDRLIESIREVRLTEIPVEEAQRIIREKLESLA